jgi:hypothetical protein
MTNPTVKFCSYPTCAISNMWHSWSLHPGNTISFQHFIFFFLPLAAASQAQFTPWTCRIGGIPGLSPHSSLHLHSPWDNSIPTHCLKYDVSADYLRIHVFSLYLVYELQTSSTTAIAFIISPLRLGKRPLFSKIKGSPPLLNKIGVFYWEGSEDNGGLHGQWTGGHSWQWLCLMALMATGSSGWHLGCLSPATHDWLVVAYGSAMLGNAYEGCIFRIQRKKFHSL